MTLPPDQQKIVADWIKKHWKKCPSCGTGPKWIVAGAFYLSSNHKSPDGSKVTAQFEVIPVTCDSCRAVSWLNKSAFPM